VTVACFLQEDSSIRAATEQVIKIPWGVRISVSLPRVIVRYMGAESFE
jgi:hypothetical protein